MRRTRKPVPPIAAAEPDKIVISNIAGAYVIRFMDKGLELELTTTARELKTTPEILIVDAVAAYLGRRG